MQKIYLVLICLSIFTCGSNKNEKPIDEESKSDRTKFEIDNFDISFQLPEGWQVAIDSSNIVAIKDNCLTNPGFCSNLVIRTLDNVDQLTMEEIVNLYIQGLDKRFEEVRVVKISDEKINSVEFKVIDYKLFENGVNLGSTYAFAIIKSKIISLNFAAENVPEGNYLKRREVFSEVFNSIEF